MKKLLALSLVAVLIMQPLTAQAETKYKTRYTKGITNLYDLPNSSENEVVYRINNNMKLKTISKGKTYTSVKYRKKVLFVENSHIRKKPSKTKVTSKQFRYNGVVRYNGYRWTWYSEKVLPGGGLKIKGRHVDNHGFVADRDGFIVLASSELKKGTILRTPFYGKYGKIYDSGCPYGTIDVYVGW